MKKIIKMPDVGEGVAEAEIVEWHVAVGDYVTEDQLLAEVMTNKATVEVPSPVAGTVLQIGPDTGTVMAVGAMLVEIETEGAAVDHSSQPIGAEPVTRPEMTNVVIQQSADNMYDKPTASPAVRALVKELGIDLRLVKGSGPEGRVTRDDIDMFNSQNNDHIDGVETVKITGLRRQTAERMAKASREVAHFSYVEEVDVTELETLRADLNTQYAVTRGKLTILPFILRALVTALYDFPQMNALYDDHVQILRRYKAAHIGVATQTPSGLMVPVVHHAEALDIWALAAKIAQLSGAARDGSARREELTGSTITVTSLGELGGLVTTPIINQPEVAIIGVNRIAIRPQWQDNQFVPRKMMNLSASFDHRMIDGYEAASFIKAIKELLEVPERLLVV
jgi:2-oxoisovalerate dehydrogenase E2 component (dihydrolipoyl transacylase)